MDSTETPPFLGETFIIFNNANLHYKIAAVMSGFIESLGPGDFVTGIIFVCSFLPCIRLVI